MIKHELRVFGTSFANAQTPQGMGWTTSWDRLVERIKNPRVLSWGNPSNEEIDRRKRTELKGWNFARFNRDYRAQGGFQSVCALGFDIDHDADIDGIALRLACFAGIVHTSIKHSQETQRCRVFLPLSRPVNAEEYSRLWAELAPMVGNVDQSTKDPGRLWFQPCHIAGREYRAFELGNGLIDVDATLARLPQPEKPQPEPVSSAGLTLARAAVAERAARWLEKADPAISGSGGQAQTWRVALAMTRGFGLSVDAALLVLGPWNARCKPPWRLSELRRCVERASHESHLSNGYLLEGGSR